MDVKFAMAAAQLPPQIEGSNGGPVAERHSRSGRHHAFPIKAASHLDPEACRPALPGPDERYTA